MGTGPRPEVAPNWFEQPAGGIAVNAFVGIDENATSSGSPHGLHHPVHIHQHGHDTLFYQGSTPLPRQMTWYKGPYASMYDSTLNIRAQAAGTPLPPMPGKGTGRWAVGFDHRPDYTTQNAWKEGKDEAESYEFYLGNLSRNEKHHHLNGRRKI